MRSILNYIDEALFSSASEFSKADNIDEQEFVDLGLSVNWAKCNLGAEKETDFGHYYMWGSTEPNDNDKCCWENAPFNNNLRGINWGYFDSVKNKVCPDGILATKYDAAYQESNGDARMPTKEEFNELINNTNHKWIENYNDNNVNGIKFTNKHDNSKFIFIPAAGFHLDSPADDNGVYVWSASIYDRFDGGAWELFSKMNTLSINGNDRKAGCSIRPVKDK